MPLRICPVCNRKFRLQKKIRDFEQKKIELKKLFLTYGIRILDLS